VTAGVLGGLVIWHGMSGVRDGTTKWARNVFLASIVYLPVLFSIMVIDGRA
jgi:heme O synthase-like polyprenyltransferase